MSILSSPATFSGNKLTQPSFDHFSPANLKDCAQISSPLNNGSDAAPGKISARKGCGHNSFARCTQAGIKQQFER